LNTATKTGLKRGNESFVDEFKIRVGLKLNLKAGVGQCGVPECWLGKYSYSKESLNAEQSVQSIQRSFIDIHNYIVEKMRSGWVQSIMKGMACNTVQFEYILCSVHGKKWLEQVWISSYIFKRPFFFFSLFFFE
jgi:hypothetical protein